MNHQQKLEKKRHDLWVAAKLNPDTHFGMNVDSHIRSRFYDLCMGCEEYTFEELYPDNSWFDIKKNIK